jgi:erythromycin esterase
MLRLSHVAAFLALSLTLGSHSALSAPTLISGSLEGWTTAHPSTNYDVAADPTVQHAGKPSVLIAARAAQSHGQDFQGTAQFFDATPLVGKRLRFTAYVKTQNAASGGLWMRVDGAGGILGFDNMSDRAIVGTTAWTSYPVVLDIPTGSVRVVYGALLSGAGKLWISDVRVEVVGDEVQVTKPPIAVSPAPTGPAKATLDAIVGQIRATAVPIAGDDPGLSLDDLAPLRGIVGTAHVVALGEGSHGTAEFFNMKHRMLRFLVEQMGFTVFAMEANWSDAQAVDDYIKTGHGSARAALDGLGFWTWDTQEVLDLIEWMRSYNAVPGTHPQLSFAGFDLQAPAGAARIVVDYARRYDSSDVPKIEHDYACFSGSFAQASQSGSVGATCRASVEAVAALLDAKRSHLVKASTTDAFLVARNAADVVEQAETVNAGLLDRDAAMAKDVEWLVRERYPGQKIVLWAHNGHVAVSPGLSYETMGSHLRKSFGADMLVFGMTFDSGEIRAKAVANGRPSGAPIPLEVSPPAAGSSESVFHATAIPRFILPLIGTQPDSPLGAWLAQPHGIEMIGAGYDPSVPGMGEVPVLLPAAFDALIYFDTSHPSRLLPDAVMAPRQVTLRSGAGGAQLSPYWSLRVHGSAVYITGADAAIVHEGPLSAYVRSAGPVGSNDYASFRQDLDPKPYRGKRIRIAGYVRSRDVDPGAACWARVDGTDGKTLSGDYMQDRLVKGTTDWQPFAIVLDVPTESAAIHFGLLLAGSGQIWVDDVTIQPVSTSVPVTSKS